LKKGNQENNKRRITSDNCDYIFIRAGEWRPNNETADEDEKNIVNKYRVYWELTVCDHQNGITFD
jgi:hypothetical protein